jgi:hypothetical protein
VYCICPDRTFAEEIETIEMTKEEKSKFFRLKNMKSKISDE